MIHLVGDVTDASTHFAQVGLAAILEDAGVRRVRIFWEDGPSARAVVTWDGEADVGQIVKDHAMRCCSASSWVSQTVTEWSEKGKEIVLGVFSPRVAKRASTELTKRWVARRREELDRLPLTSLDRAMVGGLGEPAHCHLSLTVDTDKYEPDRGATRWEMTTRNGGNNFIPGALKKFAETISNRDPRGIVFGLRGLSLVDDHGQEGTTPLGFRNRSPMDTATAWCMLWGMAATTLVPKPLSSRASRGLSQTCGTWPRHIIHPGFMTLPVFKKPTSVSRWSGIMRSRAWDDVVQAAGPWQVSPLTAAQLAMWGVTQGVRFETEVVGSKSAPERRLRVGSVFRVSDE